MRLFEQKFGFIALVVFALTTLACAEKDGESADDLDLVDPSLYEGCTSQEGGDVQPGLTQDFRDWLSNSQYAQYDFFRGDLEGGSFGGFASASDCIRREPIIFVHGNSDQAIGGDIGGWQESVAYMVSRGYRGAELYGTTYGPASSLSASLYYHSKENIMQVRAFIEAVLEYTGADKVDVISHSMGVTIARKAIKGGRANDLADGGDYNVGPALTSRVDTFVGIAGGNQGLSACYFAPTTPTCAPTNGFYPGYLNLFGLVVNQSNILTDLNATSRYEGAYRYSIWSTVDEVVTGACLVWGRNTCRVPNHNGEKVYSSYPYGHIGVRDRTAAVQYNMITSHVAN